MQRRTLATITREPNIIKNLLALMIFGKFENPTGRPEVPLEASGSPQTSRGRGIGGLPEASEGASGRPEHRLTVNSGGLSID